MGHHTIDLRDGRGRTFHVVDVENLGGGAACDDDELRRRLADCRGVARWREGDMTVAAASHFCLRRSAFLVRDALPCRLLAAGGGPDAADLALLHDLDPAWLRDRFERVVIGSGDGIFAPVAAELVSRGLRVEAISRAGSMSRALRASVHLAYEIVQLPAVEPAPSG